MESTRQALRRIRADNAALLKDFHDDGDVATLVLATTNPVTGRAIEGEVSARTLLTAHRAKLADQIGFGFQIAIGVANTVCVTTLLVVGVRGLSNRRNESNLACLYYLGLVCWYLQVIVARTAIIRDAMPEFTVRTRHIWGGSDFGDSKVNAADDHHRLHRPLPAMILHCTLVVLHWLARELTPLLMSPVGPVVEPLMDWYLGIDPFLFCRSSPDTRTLRIQNLTRALDEYEDREATRAADLRRPIPPSTPLRNNQAASASAAAAAAETAAAPVSTSSSSSSSSEGGFDARGPSSRRHGIAAPPINVYFRLPRCCFELFDGFRRRAGVARALSECTFLGGAHQGTVLRGFVILTLSLIPIGLRCVGDTPASSDLICFGSGVLYITLLIFSYCWREDPAHHMARFLTSVADGFSIFTMSILGFAPQVSLAELPLGPWLVLQCALAAFAVLFGIHLWVAWDSARWITALRAPRQPLVQRQFTGAMGPVHAAHGWATVWLWRVPKHIGAWLVRSLFATVTVGMDRVSAFWSVDMAFGWYIGGTRFSRMVEGAVAGAVTAESKRVIAEAGKRVAERSTPRVRALSRRNTANEWPILGYVGPYDKRVLWAYVGCQVPAAILPFAVVIAMFTAADPGVINRWPPLLRLAALVSVFATLLAVGVLTHLVRRFWDFRGWLVRGEVHKEFLRALVDHHRPPVSALLKRQAVHHTVLPADVIDHVVGPFTPADELTDRLSLADCAILGFGAKEPHA